MESKKKIVIAVGVLVAASIGFYLYRKNQGPTPEEIEAARQEQIRKENVAHLLNVSSQMAQAVSTGGRAAVQLPDNLKSSRDLSEVLKFPTKPVAGLGSAYALT